MGVDSDSICSGSGATPSGTDCPTAGMSTDMQCHSGLPSWDGKTCTLAEDTVCQKIASGAWGCVIPKLGCSGDAPTPCPTDEPTVVPTTPYPTEEPTEEPTTEEPTTEEPTTEEPTTMEPTTTMDNSTTTTTTSMEPTTTMDNSTTTTPTSM